MTDPEDEPIEESPIEEVGESEPTEEDAGMDDDPPGGEG